MARSAASAARSAAGGTPRGRPLQLRYRLSGLGTTDELRQASFSCFGLPRAHDPEGAGALVPGRLCPEEGPSRRVRTKPHLKCATEGARAILVRVRWCLPLLERHCSCRPQATRRLKFQRSPDVHLAPGVAGDLTQHPVHTACEGEDDGGQKLGRGEVRERNRTRTTTPG